MEHSSPCQQLVEMLTKVAIIDFERNVNIRCLDEMKNDIKESKNEIIKLKTRLTIITAIASCIGAIAGSIISRVSILDLTQIISK